MKNIFTLILLLCINITTFSQEKSDNSEKQRYLKTVTNGSTAIFEGTIIKKNKAFWGTGDYKDDIYTSYTVQVDAVLYGNITTGTVEIVVRGGQLEKDGIGTSIRPSHDEGLCSGSGVFFCNPFTKGTSGVVNSNPGDYHVIANYCDSDMVGTNSSNADTYTNKEELYRDLGKFQPVTLPAKKKF